MNACLKRGNLYQKPVPQGIFQTPRGTVSQRNEEKDKKIKKKSGFHTFIEVKVIDVESKRFITKERSKRSIKSGISNSNCRIGSRRAW